MTEAEWRTSGDPKALLDHIAGTAGDRKLRLFAAACVRDVWHMLKDDCSRRSVEVGEAARRRQGDATRRMKLRSPPGNGSGMRRARRTTARTPPPVPRELPSRRGCIENLFMGRTETIRDNLEIVLINLAWGDSSSDAIPVVA